MRPSRLRLHGASLVFTDSAFFFSFRTLGWSAALVCLFSAFKAVRRAHESSPLSPLQACVMIGPISHAIYSLPYPLYGPTAVGCFTSSGSPPNNTILRYGPSPFLSPSFGNDAPYLTLTFLPFSPSGRLTIRSLYLLLSEQRRFSSWVGPLLGLLLLRCASFDATNSFPSHCCSLRRRDLRLVHSHRCSRREGLESGFSRPEVYLGQSLVSFPSFMLLLPFLTCSSLVFQSRGRLPWSSKSQSRSTSNPTSTVRSVRLTTANSVRPFLPCFLCFFGWLTFPLLLVLVLYRLLV